MKNKYIMPKRLFRTHTKKDGTVVKYYYDSKKTNKDRPYYKKARAEAATRYKERKTAVEEKPTTAAKPCIYCGKSNRSEINLCRKWVNCDYRRMK